MNTCDDKKMKFIKTSILNGHIKMKSAFIFPFDHSFFLCKGNVMLSRKSQLKKNSNSIMCYR